MVALWRVGTVIVHTEGDKCILLSEGTQVDKRYEVYCFADPLFYDSTTQAPEESPGFELAQLPVPSGWERSELEDWLDPE